MYPRLSGSDAASRTCCYLLLVPPSWETYEGDAGNGLEGGRNCPEGHQSWVVGREKRNAQVQVQAKCRSTRVPRYKAFRKQQAQSQSTGDKSTDMPDAYCTPEKKHEEDKYQEHYPFPRVQGPSSNLYQHTTQGWLAQFQVVNAVLLRISKLRRRFQFSVSFEDCLHSTLGWVWKILGIRKLV